MANRKSFLRCSGDRDMVCGDAVMVDRMGR